MASTGELVLDCEINIDPSTLSINERNKLNIKELPNSLNKALDELENDTILNSSLGEMLSKSFLAVRRSEVSIYAKQDEAFEIRNHFYKY